MNPNARRLALGSAAAALAIALIAGPVAAAAPERVEWSDSYLVAHDCGVVEATTLTASERAFFDGGAWARSVIQFRFDGVFTGPTGKTYASTSHQTLIITPETLAVSGQGVFLRGPGGVLVMDTGHLRIDRASGATIQSSAQAIAYDDVEAIAGVDAALCEQLG